MIMTEAMPHILEQEAAWLARVRLRLQRRVRWQRTLHGGEEGEGDGLPPTLHTQVDQLLADPVVVDAVEAAFYASDSVARELEEFIQAADERAAQEPRWQKLCSRFALTPPEADLFAMAAAVEIDPGLRRVYHYLHNGDLHSDLAAPTPRLAARLFQWPHGVTFGPEHAIVRWQLATPVESMGYPWAMTTPWVADGAMAVWLSQGQRDDALLGNAISVVERRGVEAQPCLYPELFGAVQQFLSALKLKAKGAAAWALDEPVPIAVELVGPSGCGKRTLAAQVAAWLGAELLAVDATQLLAGRSGAQAQAALVRVVRLAELHEQLIYWHNLEGVEPHQWAALPQVEGLAFWGMRSPTAIPMKGVARRAFLLPQLTRGQRVATWQCLSSQPVPTPVAEWQLTPAEITQVALVAPAGPEAMAELSRRLLYQGESELFAQLPCPYSWDDIVLAPAVREHLSELANQMRHRWQVYEEWGFGRALPLGKGITALFAGPSGTGKTMAAQVLARSLEMDLYRVDLAGVVNKYIGETEKRLKQVFDACERTNMLLFFDEADALFGQRMQVKDAHDRFANIEIDYLLQRMEQFNGLAILATNRKNELDKAFLRRLRFIIDFLPPTPAERLALWRLALPLTAVDGSPLLETIDWDFLANKLTMTGADIKLAALGAAFLARTEGKRISMTHLLSAARRELSKHGVVVRLGEWEPLHSKQ